MNLRFIENIFTDETVLDIDYITESFKQGIPVINMYVITIDEETGKMEIMSSFQYFGGLNNKKEKVVCGISGGKYAAYRLFAEILDYGISKGWDINTLGKELIKE